MTDREESGSTQQLFDLLSRRELEILSYLAKGSSDREIASALFLSLNTVKWYNRQIYSKLGVPNRRQAVALARREGLVKPPVVVHWAAATHKHDLPAQLTSFVGREAEIAHIIERLSAVRLLTLTGPGGVGKTRLSLMAAHALKEAGQFPDGIFFFEFAPLSDPTLLAAAMIETLELPDTNSEDAADALKRFFFHRDCLIIMDNLEHILAGVPLISDLLKATTDLKVLATSRENLRLSGEHIFVVPPLEPESAVRLFEQRALALQHTLEFDEQARDTAQWIAARLDGLPLAIELAAARMVLLSPDELRQQLAHRLDILKASNRDVPQRHHTLRATIDWSYDLLNDGEKILFNRMGVFVGGCSLEAIDAICSRDLSIPLFDALEALLNKNLIQREETALGEPGFVMLETLREYALEKLAASHEADTIRNLHAGYYASLAEQAEPALKNLTGGIERWSQRIAAAFDNLRAAFFWSMEGDVLPGLRILNALDGLWWYTHFAPQGNRWIDLALQKIDQAPAAVQAQTLITSGMVALTRGDWELSRERGLEALSIVRQLDDQPTQAFILGRLGITELNTRRFESAEDYLTQALQLYDRLDDPGGTAFVLNGFGELMRMQNRYQEAEAYYQHSIDLRGQSGGEEGSAALYNLANIKRHLGDDASAYHLYQQALEFSLRANHTFLACAALMGMAGIIAVQGDPLLAARLLGTTEAVLEAHHHTIQPSDQADYDRSINDTRALLDQEAFDAAWAEGRAMTLDQAAALALND